MHMIKAAGSVDSTTEALKPSVNNDIVYCINKKK